MKLRVSLIALALAMVPLIAMGQSPTEIVGEVPAAVSTTDVQSNDMPKFFHRDGDSFKSPQSLEAFTNRQVALQQRLAGKGRGKVHQIAKGQYVELGLERSDRIFVVIVEYGDQVSTNPLVSAAPGPRHNQMPEPDRSVDNNTIWQADYSSDHFRDMYNHQMTDYYHSQSSGRYTVNGSVTEWVRVPFNGPRYGSNRLGDASAWTLIADAINAWTNDQLAAGWSLEEVQAYLRTFDTWDRYDYDHDGDFDEPDGYIDHFQIVHAGAGEETGGGLLGADAIWSHRWFAWYNLRGYTGPDYNPNGGVEFGGGWGANPTGDTYGASSSYVRGIHGSRADAANVQDAYPVNHTGIWVGDYTIQPENGGLGVFAHEYGHDLGLPDHYDTSGTGSNSIAFWNIMANASYLGGGTVDIGSKPGDMSAWDKLQLGWLNYDICLSGKFSTHRLGPAETNTKAAQGLIVVLPPDKNVFYLYDPVAGGLPYGTTAWWGGAGDLLDNSMTRQIAVPAGTPYLYMRVMYAIESGWDYAYVAVSTDGGASWTNLPGQYQNSSGGWSNLTTTSNPNGQNLGNGITGSSSGAWRYARFAMGAYAGQNVLLRIRYKTDEYTYLKGILVDEIALGNFTDGAEAGDNGWTLNGFRATTGVEPSNFNHYYIAEYRQYRDYDAGLQTGPYIFGYAEFPEKVAHYPYQDGLLITYWDTGESNDNSPQHYGEGRSLPVDAHPEPLLRYVQFPGRDPFYSPWSAFVQSYDSTFGLQATDALMLPYAGIMNNVLYQFWQSHPSLPAVPEFNDLNSYWSPLTPSAGVIVPKTGTIIRVVNTNTQGNFMEVQVDSVK